MENNIKELEIKNFKSIKHIKFNPKRVNVFIGKPNVGKSNILEGLKLLSSTYNTHTSRDFFKDENFIRYNTLHNLFFDEEVSKKIEISTDKCNANLFYETGEFKFSVSNNDAFWNFFRELFDKSEIANSDNNIFDFYQYYISNIGGTFGKENQLKYDRENQANKGIYTLPFTARYQSSGRNISTGILIEGMNSLPRMPIRGYAFKEMDNYGGDFRDYLFPPFGDNLFSVLDLDKELQDEVASFLDEQKLEFVLDKKDSKFILQKKVGRVVYQVPYSNIADTLKRVVFYLSAIETNKNAVLLFEEPEVHSYPPYIKMLADRIVLDDENQYFLSTHSPYMLNTLINSLGDDELNVVLTYYEDYQTKVKVLSREELKQIQDWEMDVFFNLDKFTNQLQES